MIILGVDFGDARTGLAICDKGEMLASPIGVISEHDFDRCMEKVADAAKEHRAQMDCCWISKKYEWHHRRKSRTMPALCRWITEINESSG